MHDNRKYAAVDASNGNLVQIYQVKVGKQPSYPTDIVCQTIVEKMVMRCKWDLGLQAFLPWAKSTTSLRYKKFIISTATDEDLRKLKFTENDELFDCPEYCTQGNVGCCELQVFLRKLSYIMYCKIILQILINIFI